jgi:tRNA pseudouridine65 synthase
MDANPSGMTPPALEVLYQDDYYIAVHKPSGLLVHRSPVDKHETRFCLQMLRDQVGQRVYPCHRLDKPTSGVLLFALGKDAHREASILFSDKGTRKTYRAIVRGWMGDSGTLDYPLADIPNGGVVRGRGEPRDAVTRFRCLRQFEVNKPLGRYQTARYSEVELVPETGRTHQLRRHMKHLDHHIIGDSRYGDGLHNRFFREKFQSNRLLLSAVKLEFLHPFRKIDIVIQRGDDPEYDHVLEKLPLRA